MGELDAPDVTELVSIAELAALRAVAEAARCVEGAVAAWIDHDDDGDHLAPNAGVREMLKYLSGTLSDLDGIK